eukprot:GGOE01036651.1.p2 GENE.GGOE01036651.1~~GGOE01036651.1.p2  ORF type:complete len:324 (-),score=91.68 GGOE01036651.1:204-1175(-)
MGDAFDLQAQLESLKAKIKEDLARAPPAISTSSPSCGLVTNEALAEEYKVKGNEAFRRGDYRAAVDLFTKGLSFDGNNAVLYSNRSASFCHLKKWERALEDANSCIELQPAWPKGHMRRGAALYGYGFLDKALEAYQVAYKDDLQNEEYLKLVETITKEQEKRQKAEKVSELREKAKEQFAKGDFKGAAGLYKKAIEEDGTDAVLFSNRSACYTNMQKYAKAVADAEKAIELAPKWGKAWRRKAAAYYAWKKHTEAIQAYKELLEIEPSEELRNLIIHIQNEQLTRQYVKEDMMPGGKRKGTFQYGPAKKAKDDETFDFNEKW